MDHLEQAPRTASPQPPAHSYQAIISCIQKADSTSFFLCIYFTPAVPHFLARSSLFL
jgi:hypothetical protein